jgi:hypothetical protein
MVNSVLHPRPASLLVSRGEKMCINLGQQDLRICEEGCFYRHGIVGPPVCGKTVSSLLYCSRSSILRVVEPSFDSALLSRFDPSPIYEHFKLQTLLGLPHIRTPFNRTYRRIFVLSSLTWSFRTARFHRSSIASSLYALCRTSSCLATSTMAMITPSRSYFLERQGRYNRVNRWQGANYSRRQLFILSHFRCHIPLRFSQAVFFLETVPPHPPLHC